MFQIVQLLSIIIAAIAIICIFFLFWRQRDANNKISNLEECIANIFETMKISSKNQTEVLDVVSNVVNQSKKTTTQLKNFIDDFETEKTKKILIQRVVSGPKQKPN